MLGAVDGVVCNTFAGIAYDNARTAVGIPDFLAEKFAESGADIVGLLNGVVLVSGLEEDNHELCHVIAAQDIAVPRMAGEKV